MDTVAYLVKLIDGAIVGPALINLCAYIQIYIYIHVTCVYACARIHICVCVFVHVYRHTYMSVYMRVRVCIYIYVYMYLYVHMYTCMYVCTYLCIVCVRVCTHTHTYVCHGVFWRVIRGTQNIIMKTIARLSFSIMGIQPSSRIQFWDVALKVTPAAPLDHLYQYVGNSLTSKPFVSASKDLSFNYQDWHQESSSSNLILIDSNHILTCD